jgi:hypothetical protein
VFVDSFDLALQAFAGQRGKVIGSQFSLDSLRFVGQLL